MTERPRAFDTSDEERVGDEGRRWEVIESALGSIAAVGHAWDDDPAAWVRAQRHHEPLDVRNGPTDG
jgi:hypothetical protein